MSLKLPRNWDFSAFKAETARIALSAVLPARPRSVTPGEGSAGSPGSPGSPRGPGGADRPMKAGWLKKQQRSIVKNWQHRYFVLRGSTLTYHKDDKESTVQGVIQLRYSKVNELPANSEEPGKYLFQIIPRSNRDRERYPYVFMATSQSDMEEWVRTLRRAVGVQTSGVFGKSLVDTVTYERRFSPRMVPILVQKCAEYIREQGLNEEGIFRLPGQDNTVKQFRDAFDAGERPSFPSDTDVHTVASLLKLYLRELPEPVVPWTQYQDFLDSITLMDPNSTTGREKLEQQITLLPRINYNLLGYICRFLFEVQLNSKVNKMSVENLATVMGINLLKPQIEDPISMMKATPQIQKLMTVMIRQHETLFPPSKDVLPSRPSSNAQRKKSSAPRNFVGWECAEMGDASLSESPEEEEDTDSPDGGDCYPTCQEPSSPSSNDLSPSPRKRTQTLPSFQCLPKGITAKADACNRWSRIQEFPEEKGGTLSEDIFKILDLQRSLLFGGPQKTADKQEEGIAPTERRSDITASSIDGSPRPNSEPQPSQLMSHQQSPAVSLAGTSPGPGSHNQSGSPPAGSPCVSQSVSQSDSLQHTRKFMDSLQQKNDELSATVTELRAALEVERRHVAALEICLRNAEHSRNEVQRRNRELDKEVQEFLARAPT